MNISENSSAEPQDEPTAESRSAPAAEAGREPQAGGGSAPPLCSASGVSDKQDQILPLLLEAHELNGVEWGVSFGGSNPESDEYVAMNNKSDCVKLIDLINRSIK